MTNQEIFNKMYTGVVTQGAFSFSGGMCRYRLDGLKCAAGHLIPDDKYNDTIEGCSVLAFDGTPSKITELFVSLGFNTNQILFINQAQVIHDRNAEHGTMRDFISEMADLAQDYGLVVPKIEPKLIAGNG